ncbi:hypothetical protein GOV09_01225 [Candidatus Woesearchaeota archaeon]|nr:hypothetical protein [Candidatus Woesearchaeota archaeon]
MIAERNVHIPLDEFLQRLEALGLDLGQTVEWVWNGSEPTINLYREGRFIASNDRPLARDLEGTDYEIQCIIPIGYHILRELGRKDSPTAVIELNRLGDLGTHSHVTWPAEALAIMGVLRVAGEIKKEGYSAQPRYEITDLSPYGVVFCELGKRNPEASAAAPRR